ncbi:hypothetical protein [Asaia krungthepensis]|uniref:Uncharacterized protein n=1 Tax=Asaia krungthepensis NRIC 0535 TaxID=1307925 RepID=A0ABQ0PVM5_9PROT|nr:hypothetical protein [Asaia krungthepensis]GBQ82760.1 hypothetical protein AA0535_0071 [Asaia krungthepensis NRIC 0535]
MLYASARFWLLDFFGHVVDHDPLRDCLFSVVPPPGRYPGLFFFADSVALQQFTVTLRKIVSLPVPIPQLQATRQTNGLITLQRLDGTGRYLRSVENAGIDFQATEAKDWEHFLILSEPMMHSYAILSQGEVSVITDPDEEILSPMSFVEGFKGRIGPHDFSLAANLTALEDLSSLEVGSGAPLVLRTDQGEEITLTVTRS